ncbi:hypothetical protein [Photobacterium damselae]|uniref:hypothetical protein n=1 Tax=Photobacterium damselae TaxID=38293 RepID=UPI004067AC5A
MLNVSFVANEFKELLNDEQDAIEVSVNNNWMVDDDVSEINVVSVINSDVE